MNRAISPTLQPISGISFAQPKELSLRNGYKGFAFNFKGFEGVQLDIVIQGGYHKAKNLLNGLFAYRLLLHGTVDKNRQTIADHLNLMGAYVQIKPSLCHSTLSISCLAENFKSVLEVVFSAIEGAVFPEKELEIAINKSKTKLKINQKETAYQAGKTFKSMLYGVGPLAYTPEEKDYNQVSQGDLLGFYNDHVATLNGYFVLSYGNQAVLDDLVCFLEQKPGVYSTKEEPLPYSSSTEKFANVEVAGAVQDSVIVGKQQITPQHVDYDKLLFVNTLFGGFFGSRLMKNIREEKGLTYGIHSGIRRNNQYFVQVIQSDVKGGSGKHCLDEIKKEMKSLQQNTVGSQEIDVVKNYILGSLLAQTNEYTSYNKLFIRRIQYGHKDNYIEKRVASVNAMTAKDVLEISNTYLTFDSFHKVIAKAPD